MAGNPVSANIKGLESDRGVSDTSETAGMAPLPALATFHHRNLSWNVGLICNNQENRDMNYPDLGSTNSERVRLMVSGQSSLPTEHLSMFHSVVLKWILYFGLVFSDCVLFMTFPVRVCYEIENILNQLLCSCNFASRYR